MDDPFVCGVISCGATTLFQDVAEYTGPERREHKRAAASVGITVQPLDARQREAAPPFDAVTRDVSTGGLSFINSHRANYEMVAIWRNNDPSRLVVCRVCKSNVIPGLDPELSYLVSVEFLYEKLV